MSSSAAAHSSEASTSNFLLGSLTTHQNSSKYRAYASAVDKALKSFESTTEWADLIAALGKLGKVFASNSKSFNDIPNSLTVAKRLSQCLHPALPSGVHIKALETYRQVFNIFGHSDRNQNLARSLFLYAIGLFPLMDHCGIKVKSELLSIFEHFLLPLGNDLRPSLPGFITAVLLALEEGTEFYLRAFQLLNQLIEKVGSDAFYTCFWQAVGGSSSVRLPALIFINAKLEKRKQPQTNSELLHTISGGDQASSSDQMMRALSAVADDVGSALTQRHLLDFLCTALPLDSDWVPRKAMIQLLRRCIFVVLRRDMSLNRRLYQWLLNRSNDMGFVGLPVNGTEDSTDLAFFKKYTLPLIKMAIGDYLQSADTVEVPHLSTGTIRRFGTLMKDPQVQFPEVRICRLLHYMLDRPELGQLVLEESLADLLETICLRDVNLINELQKDCEEMDPNFEGYLNLNETNTFSATKDDEQMKRRSDEITKNFNVMLNSVEPNFLWNFFRHLFIKLNTQKEGDVGDISTTVQDDPSDDRKSLLLCTHKDPRMVFPLMVLFGVRNVQLDRHEHIRGKQLPELFQCILHGTRPGGGQFSLGNLVANIAICRRLLAEITQNNLPMVFESINESSPSKKGIKCNKELAEEQKLVECCLAEALELLRIVCDWYTTGDRDCFRIGALTSICAMVRDFADFPFYSLQTTSALSTTDQSPCRSLMCSLGDTCAASDDERLPGWLNSMLGVIAPPSWSTTRCSADFEMRNRMFELLLYLCVRSASMIEQHSAVFGRAQQQQMNGTDTAKNMHQKTTTTVLLKPFISQTYLAHIEKDGLYQMASAVLWKCFSENTDVYALQSIALLLLRLHSRRVIETSSELEDIIVRELTSPNKLISGQAARKFRDLWVFCRSSMEEEVYAGITLKPMNRAVMVFLGFITADEKLCAEQVELKALAFSWFLDCARHNDLHKILQMLTLILLNPATARVSIQYVQIRKRITREQLPSMPPEINCVALNTTSGKQTFHHICTDVERREQNLPLQNSAGNNYNYVECNAHLHWVSELNKQLLLHSFNNGNIGEGGVFDMGGHQHRLMDSRPEGSTIFCSSAPPAIDYDTSIQQQSLVGGDKCHQRTMSDIPQFDGDAESVDSYSLDTLLDPEVVEVVQFLVDSICEVYEAKEVEDGVTGEAMDESINNRERTLDNVDENSKMGMVKHQFGEAEMFNRSSRAFDKRDRAASAQEADDQISLVGSLLSPAGTAAAVPRISSYGGAGGDTIRRIRTGHRRQDSLQESIFSTGTHELRLFDLSELPNSTGHGDYKQPLLDEVFSHLLFYADSPSIVDLGRAEKLFRTIGTLLKSGNGLGRHLVNSMLFTSMLAAEPRGVSAVVDNSAKSTTIGGASAASSQQLLDFMARHYRHMQGDGFWSAAGNPPKEEETNERQEGSGTTTTTENNKSQPPKLSTLFEIFTMVVLYFVRSYYLNSPTSHVSEDDLVLSWKCKIAALDCFTEMLNILDETVKETNSKEFAAFIQHIYRQTKTQKVVLTLMLAAIPTPTNQKGWRMPLTMDIAEFNNGPQMSSHFRDLIFAYHRSLLSLASTMVVLEYSLQVGTRHFSSQSHFGFTINNFIGGSAITENLINYNSSQNRSTIREARYSVVELRLFLGVILNALRRSPERHEMWLHFLIGILPYLDRALATFVVHVVEQLCRNLYECVFINNSDPFSASSLNTPLSAHISSVLEHQKSSIQFVDYRISRANDAGSIQREDVKYPSNYILIILESLVSITHFCLLDNNSQLSSSNRAGSVALAFSSPPNLYHHHSPSRAPFAPSSSMSTNMGTFSSSNMTSMVGSAISVIPGTGLINNLFGRVFTSGENASHVAARADSGEKSPEMLEAQRELIKRLPSSLAILCDVWAFTVGKEKRNRNTPQSAGGPYKSLSSLILDMLNPIVKRHKNALMNSLGVVWMFRAHGSGKLSDSSLCSFSYSSQQIGVAKLALSLKTLSLTSIICSISDTLKDSVNKTKSGEKIGNCNLEVALLEFLHQCTKLVKVNDLRESWAALNILFNESPLSQLPARASFLEFIILTDFVRRCGNQAIIEDKQISKAILDVCQKLIDAINAIIGWQLESTTWLKRTLVVRQDATTQKLASDLSPVLEQRSSASSSSTNAVAGVPLSISALNSETNSMRGSTISLSGIGHSRMSTLDIQSTTASVAGTADAKKSGGASSSNLVRSSLKDSGARKDPHDSTQALFLLSENLADLIDSVCRNEEKEKLLPSLQSVWNNTLPYLKSKSAKNVRFFLAGSQFLASMSSYNYMRAVWKKNALDLLWDNSFFKMDIHALRQWLVVIDNLMTNDKTSFKELLARITTSTSTTFSTLITSKEQEYEMRAQYLKRLAFVILSSELDQYSGQLNEIQERLTENLRLCQVPVIHTQVFNCYRVLLIRMSPSSFVSIWPSMVTELVQVLAQIDQQLSTSNIASNIDEQKSAKDEQCMQLFLSACKLLETLCTLPSGHVSQFQMCRWTFISPMSTNTINDVFVPYAVRLNHLLNARYTELGERDLEMRSASLFGIKTLTSYQELHPFFLALTMQNGNNVDRRQHSADQLHNGQLNNEIHDSRQNLTERSSVSRLRDEHLLSGLYSLKNAVARIEQSLYVDFAEHWQL